VAAVTPEAEAATTCSASTTKSVLTTDPESVLTTGHWVPHISLVFREMWDTTVLIPGPLVFNTNLEGWRSGIPHLAKNERGTRSFVSGDRS